MIPREHCHHRGWIRHGLHAFGMARLIVGLGIAILNADAAREVYFAARTSTAWLILEQAIGRRSEQRIARSNPSPRRIEALCFKSDSSAQSGNNDSVCRDLSGFRAFSIRSSEADTEGITPRSWPSLAGRGTTSRAEPLTRRVTALAAITVRCRA